MNSTIDESNGESTFDQMNLFVQFNQYL